MVRQINLMNKQIDEQMNVLIRYHYIINKKHKQKTSKQRKCKIKKIRNTIGWNKNIKSRQKGNKNKRSEKKDYNSSITRQNCIIKFYSGDLFLQQMTFAGTLLTAKLLKLYVASLIVIAFLTWRNPQSQTPNIYSINRETHPHLHSLIQTKYFRMIRVNLNRQCQLWVRNKICKSRSCTVCRCDQKDIPTNWIKTDKVNQGLEGKDLWQKQRDSNEYSINWIWHVEDEQNDEGEYFDLYSNVESFTNYDGRSIWKLVYEQNCFNASRPNRSEAICKQEAVFYKVISGLHTSISTHISLMHKNVTPEVQMWTGLKSSEEYFVNYDEYKRRVLDHPDRVQNLLFIYQIYLRAMKQIAPYLIQNYTINSDNIVEDLRTAKLLQELARKFENYEFKPFDAELGTFFYPQNPKVQLYQKYIHNISRLMNCVECEKCRLFGKMQTYGIGTALKILLGYNAIYKRNEMVAFFNAWNKISMSVEFYYQTAGAPKQQTHYHWEPLRIFAVMFGAVIVLSFIIEYLRINRKPSERPKSQQTISEKKLIVKTEVEKINPQKNE